MIVYNCGILPKISSIIKYALFFQLDLKSFVEVTRLVKDYLMNVSPTLLRSVSEVSGKIISTCRSSPVLFNDEIINTRVFLPCMAD